MEILPVPPDALRAIGGKDNGIGSGAFSNQHTVDIETEAKVGGRIELKYDSRLNNQRIPFLYPNVRGDQVGTVFRGYPLEFSVERASYLRGVGLVVEKGAQV